MKNPAIAKVFQEIADLLEFKGENPFKIRAYRNVARTIEDLPVELAQVMQDGKLREVPGIGEAIAKKITALLTTGRVELYERLRTEFPESIRAMIAVPGVGPGMARRLYQELGVASIADLEKAIESGRVAALPRLDEKSAADILHQIQKVQQ